jgi:hypothetical protein
MRAVNAISRSLETTNLCWMSPYRNAPSHDCHEVLPAALSVPLALQKESG